VQPIYPALIAALLFQKQHVTERPPRGRTGFLRRHSAGRILADKLFEVEREFFIELPVELAPSR
jgi:hypothetical protein